MGKTSKIPETSAINIELNLFWISTLYGATPCGPGEEKMRRECDLYVAMGFCEECGKSLNTSGNMKSHIVKSQMCGRRPYFSRHILAHKMDHVNIVVSIYLPTLAVHMWHLGTEVSMCNQSVVHIFVVWSSLRAKYNYPYVCSYLTWIPEVFFQTIHF